MNVRVSETHFALTAATNATEEKGEVHTIPRILIKKRILHIPGIFLVLPKLHSMTHAQNTKTATTNNHLGGGGERVATTNAPLFLLNLERKKTGN